MFGFSLTKLLFTAAIVYVAWKAFGHFTRMKDQRANKPSVKKQNGGSRQASAPAPGKDGIEDMVECKVCNAYVTSGAKSCGRDDCPFNG